jgi:protein-tyrosine phosphatase
VRILFVCTGNICRSPMAAAVMEKLAADAGLAGEFFIDSAGTGAWHAGERAQPFAIEAAAAHGYTVEHLARAVSVADLSDFDMLVALDRGHERSLRDMSLDLELRLKVRLLLDGEDVPDPYGGPLSEFERALAMIEDGCKALFAELTSAPF